MNGNCHVVQEWSCPRHQRQCELSKTSVTHRCGYISICPDCVAEARDRVQTEIVRFRKTHGYLGGWKPFEGWR